MRRCLGILLVLIAGLGLLGRAGAADRTLTVYAAASLTGTFNALKPLFEKANPGWQVRFNYGASSTLRVQIEQGTNRWRPALMHDSGFSAWVWRQGELACFLVSDMVSEADVERFKDYFVRVRVSTEPVPAN